MIGKRLNFARKAAGLSLRDLGAQVGLSHATIKKYEDEQTTPSSGTLLELARALNVRVEYFFRADVPMLDHFEFQQCGSLPKKRLDAIKHKAIDQMERRLELENLFPVSPITSFAQVEKLPAVVTDFTQIEEATERLRQAWGLGLGPIADFTGALERRGICVVTIDVNADTEFDGLAVSVNRMPIIVVDGNWPGDRQRFTLARELGRLMLADRLAESLDEKKACIRFAGAFLIPQQSVAREFGERRNSIEPKELALLKEKFGLSMHELLCRAHDLGIVTSAQRGDQEKYFLGKGWHFKEPGKAYPADRAHVFERLVFRALAESYIGEAKAAELMNLPLATFRAARTLAARMLP